LGSAPRTLVFCVDPGVWKTTRASATANSAAHLDLISRRSMA